MSGKQSKKKTSSLPGDEPTPRDLQEVVDHNPGGGAGGVSLVGVGESTRRAVSHDYVGLKHILCSGSTL